MEDPLQVMTFAAPQSNKSKSSSFALKPISTKMLERQIEDLSVYNKPHDQAESGRQIRAELLKEQEA